MTGYTEALERARDRFRPQPGGLERMFRRRDRRRRNERIGAILVAAFLAVGAIAGLLRAFGGIERHIPVTGLDPANVSELHPIWRASTGLTSDPVVVNRVVYASSEHAGTVSAYAEGCGTHGSICRPLWTGRIAGVRNITAPAVADGSLFVADVGGRQGRLYAFSITECRAARSCRPSWTGDLLGSMAGYSDAPVVSDGVVYVGGRGGVSAFAADCPAVDGACRPAWTGPPDGYPAFEVTVSDGVVYVATYDSPPGLYAFQTDCGSGGSVCTPLWVGAGSDRFSSLPAVSGGRLYVGTDQGLEVYDGASCEAGRCRTVWHAPFGPESGPPTVANGTIYASRFDSDLLYAFRTGCADGAPDDTCEPVWTAAAAGGFGSTVAADDGLAFVGGGEDGVLYAFAASCRGRCAPLWTWRVAGPSSGGTPIGITVADGMVFAGSPDGLIAFGRPRSR